jgi:DNA-binding FadR family transcriptional regulator
MRNVSLPDQIALRLEKQIANGTLKPGSRLPTVARMAQDYGVSQPVVREALSRLRSQGLIETRQGSGSSVLAPKARRSLQLGVGRPRPRRTVCVPRGYRSRQRGACRGLRHRGRPEGAWCRHLAS